MFSKCVFSSVAYWLGVHVLLNSCITALRERCCLTLFLLSPRFGFYQSTIPSVLYIMEFLSNKYTYYKYIHIRQGLGLG